MLPLSAAYSRSWNYAKTIINSFQKVRVKCHISIYGMHYTRRTVTWRPEQFPYLVVECAINISPVDGGIERKILPVFSFKIFKVCVPGRAVPEKTKKDTKDFAVWDLTSLYQCFPQLKEWKATIKIPNVCYQPDEKWKQSWLCFCDTWEWKYQEENYFPRFSVYFHFCFVHISGVRTISPSSRSYLEATR